MKADPKEEGTELTGHQWQLFEAFLSNLHRINELKRTISSSEALIAGARQEMAMHETWIRRHREDMKELMAAAVAEAQAVVDES